MWYSIIPGEKPVSTQPIGRAKNSHHLSSEFVLALFVLNPERGYSIISYPREI
jgi:hypothetical protein